MVAPNEWWNEKKHKPMTSEDQALRHHILHVDMDAFYASVEQRDHPEWKGKPVIVGSPPDQRGVVSAASYEARVFGVRSAMPSREAGRLCPHAIFAPVRMKRYQEVSAQVFEIFHHYTPRVEGLSVDEAFLDVSASRYLFGDSVQIAGRIRADIAGQLQLTASVGVAPNKFLAKLASEINKPDGLTITPLDPEEIRPWLAPMSVRRLWGVGPRTEELLAAAGWQVVEDLQKTSLETLGKVLGSSLAAHLKALARGEDTRTVSAHAPEQSISAEYTFDVDTRDAGAVHRVLVMLAEKVGRRVRAGQWIPGTVQVKIRDADFKTITRRKPLQVADSLDTALIRAAGELYEAHTPSKAVRLLGITASDLTPLVPGQQWDLFLPPVAESPLDQAVDRLRLKLGPGAIVRGGQLPPPAQK